ID
ncbi:hypothetical protein D043_0138B, partial [Vibrio parahaemolyticus EKP-021]